METVLCLLIEIIVFGFFSFASKNIRNLQFYYGILARTKYPLFDLISFKETIIYSITKVVKDAPTFSFAPSDYEFWRKENEKENNCCLGEKIIINISLLFMHIRAVIGNVFFDFILVVTFLTCEEIICWKNIWKFVKETVKNFPMREVAELSQECLSWSQENINVLLIILIVLISLYVGFLKREKRKYLIEAVWAEEDEDRIKNVAKIQKSIETDLLEIRGSIYKNLIILQEQIRWYTKEENLKLDRLVDYKDKSDELKSFMWNITEIEGIEIYAKRNRKVYVQLMLLDLLPSLSSKKTFAKLDCMSKKYIEDTCKSKEELCKAYAYGVGLINGINRFLKFSYKKRHQYNKIVLHITDSDYIGGVFDKIK